MFHRSSRSIGSKNRQKRQRERQRRNSLNPESPKKHHGASSTTSAVQKSSFAKTLWGRVSKLLTDDTRLKKDDASGSPRKTNSLSRKHSGKRTDNDYGARNLSEQSHADISRNNSIHHVKRADDDASIHDSVIGNTIEEPLKAYGDSEIKPNHVASADITEKAVTEPSNRHRNNPNHIESNNTCQQILERIPHGCKNSSKSGVKHESIPDLTEYYDRAVNRGGYNPPRRSYSLNHKRLSTAKLDTNSASDIRLNEDHSNRSHRKIVDDSFARSSSVKYVHTDNDVEIREVPLRRYENCSKRDRLKRTVGSPNRDFSRRDVLKKTGESPARHILGKDHLKKTGESPTRYCPTEASGRSPTRDSVKGESLKRAGGSPARHFTRGESLKKLGDLPVGTFRKSESPKRTSYSPNIHFTRGENINRTGDTGDDSPDGNCTRSDNLRRTSSLPGRYFTRGVSIKTKGDSPVGIFTKAEGLNRTSGSPARDFTKTENRNRMTEAPTRECPRRDSIYTVCGSPGRSRLRHHAESDRFDQSNRATSRRHSYGNSFQEDNYTHFEQEPGFFYDKTEKNHKRHRSLSKSPKRRSKCVCRHSNVNQHDMMSVKSRQSEHVYTSKAGPSTGDRRYRHYSTPGGRYSDNISFRHGDTSAGEYDDTDNDDLLVIYQTKSPPAIEIHTRANKPPRSTSSDDLINHEPEITQPTQRAPLCITSFSPTRFDKHDRQKASADSVITYQKVGSVNVCLFLMYDILFEY